MQTSDTIPVHPSPGTSARPAGLRGDRANLLHDNGRHSGTTRASNTTGEPENAVSRDGVHIEMLQADPDTCSKLLLAWWVTMGRTALFPSE